ncbi:hypothetical protein GCM10009426_36000 [Rheinheimera tangshanensis]|nr:hypothetical protein GCM10010920_09530 [Rheinheimera tangshanensis]
MNILFGGELLEYFLVKDPKLPFHYAIGIRFSNSYGAHLIQTARINSIDTNIGVLYTIHRFYRLHHLVTDDIYIHNVHSVFKNKIIPIFDDEIVESSISLTLQ